MLDQNSQKLVGNVIKEEVILDERITSTLTATSRIHTGPDSLADIEQIEQRRQTNRETDAIYLLTPEPHIVECVVADIERRRYRQITLLWTSCRCATGQRKQALAHWGISTSPTIARKNRQMQVCKRNDYGVQGPGGRILSERIQLGHLSRPLEFSDSLSSSVQSSCPTTHGRACAKSRLESNIRGSGVVADYSRSSQFAFHSANTQPFDISNRKQHHMKPPSYAPT